jgi:hypothetical protein
MIDKPTCTPEPWTATEGYGLAYVWGPDGDLVARVYGNLAEEGDAFCNAKLMAQAQPMARLLKRFVDLDLYLDSDGYTCIRVRCPELGELQDEAEEVLEAAGVER